MKLPTFSSINFGPLFKKYVKEVPREQFIFWGVISMAFLQAALVGWAVYVFSATVLGERAPTVGPVRDISLKEEDIKRVAGLLDERVEKFKEILAAD